MPDNFKVDIPVVIYSTLDGNPYVGIPMILPAIIPVNLIERGSGIQPSRFIAQRVENNVYMLTTNGYRAIDLEGNLFGALELPPQEWVITYRENHDAYTIVKRTNAPEEIGWVAPTKDKSRQILVQPLTLPTYPPQELYRFEFPKE
ncbi:hypothetical protein EDC04DRAFT_2601045 [Pisolithus marmoratus]|nr:hypothetical protein EDC04DRAFT_2601045 [Pisolithus marmoratus]